MLKLVFACAPSKTVDDKLEYAFGLGDGLPWKHIKQDMSNFVARTKNTVMVMGAKTFASLPRLLPDRTHVVVTDMARKLPRTKTNELAHFYITQTEFITLVMGSEINLFSPATDVPFKLSTEHVDVSVIGGPALLKQALPYADEIVMTKIIKKCRVNSDVQLDKDFVQDIMLQRSMVESHYYRIDELTEITESVYK